MCFVVCRRPGGWPGAGTPGKTEHISDNESKKASSDARQKNRRGAAPKHRGGKHHTGGNSPQGNPTRQHGVLWCFVVFCGYFVAFCGCFVVFCECFAVFPQNTQNTRKTSKNTEKHKKLTIRSCIAGVQRAKKIDCIEQNTFHKTSANHRKTPQNTAKQSQNAFCV